MITCAFTWYSHPLTHTVGRTCVPHVLRWGGVVWARRGIWSGACVPASISHSVNITQQWSLPQVSYNPRSKLTFNLKNRLTWKRDSSSPGDYWTLILSDPPGQRYWCHSFVCWEDEETKMFLIVPICLAHGNISYSTMSLLKTHWSVFPHNQVMIFPQNLIFLRL